MPQRKKPGRPSLDEKSKKSHPVSVRLTQEDYDRMFEISQTTGIDPSVIARAVVRKYLDNPTPLIDPTPQKVVVSDIPFPPVEPRRPRPSPPHAAAHRVSTTRQPGTTASSTALKRLK